MNLVQKTVWGALIFGTVLTGGSWVWIHNGSPAPESTDFYIEDNCRVVEMLRITPLHRVWGLPERAFTLNDIISEIEFELRVNGESAKYEELVELRDKVEELLDDEDITENCEERVTIDQ